MNDKYAIITSEFNSEITTKLLEGAQARLQACGIGRNQIYSISVPGAIEIPLTAQLLAKTKQYSAIICLGAVIRGDTDHYHYVCTQVSQGCMQVMLQHDIPIIFGVLTTNNEEQAHERVGGKHGHKGIDAADAAVKMVAVARHLLS